MKRLLGGSLALLLAAQPGLAAQVQRVLPPASGSAALPAGVAPTPLSIEAPMLALPTSLSNDLSIPPTPLAAAAFGLGSLPASLSNVVVGGTDASASVPMPATAGIPADVPAASLPPSAAAAAVPAALALPADGSLPAARTLEDRVWAHAEERGFARAEPRDAVLAHPGEAPSGLSPAGPASPDDGADKGKGGGFGLKVFDDPERNSAFWRSFIAEQVLNLGFQMYIVAMPYFIQSFTQNAARPATGAAVEAAKAMEEEVRRNRSLSRMVHWVAQAVSYSLTPLFTSKDEGPRRWLVRSSYLRALALGAIPVVFFASGLMSFPVALGTLLVLIAAQSFFQGVHVTTASGAVAKIIGDPSVTPRERMRANSLRTLATSLVSILAPAVAGRIAQVKDLFGKSGAGGALIYGVYALTMALSGFIYSTIRMLSLKSEAAGVAQTPAPAGLGGALSELWASLKEGLRLTWQNRFLRTFLGLSLLISLFSDPLVFNVLPEYVDGILKASPANVDWLKGIPLLGWFVEGLTGSAMGFFGLLMAFSSLGFGLASLLLEPLKDLLKRIGFKTEESLLLPLYGVALIEVPAFWAMVFFPSFWSVLLLYGLQALASGFAALVVTGIHQKNLGRYTPRQLNQILAANSLLGMLAAILVTWLYGFVLTSIPVRTSLIIAGSAVTLLALLRLASPWLYFSKAERGGGGPSFFAPASAPPREAPPEEGGFTPLSSRL